MPLHQSRYRPALVDLTYESLCAVLKSALRGAVRLTDHPVFGAVDLHLFQVEYTDKLGCDYVAHGCLTVAGQALTPVWVRCRWDVVEWSVADSWLLAHWPTIAQQQAREIEWYAPGFEKLPQPDLKRAKAQMEALYGKQVVLVAPSTPKLRKAA